MDFMQVEPNSNSNPSVVDTSDKKENENFELSLSCSLEQTRIPFSVKQKVVAMATIKAPFYESDTRKSRAPIDLVAAVDRSQSMEGSKIKLVRETLKFMIQQLKEEDNFGVVLYDTTVHVLFKPRKMDAEGKKIALQLVENIETKGTTNLSGGLFQSLMDIAQLKSSHDVSAVMLFTDGLANAGVTQSEKLVKGVEGLLQHISNPCSVFTFGFGDDHEPNVLKSLADSGNGIYYYIENQEAIPAAFADCLGGLLSVCAQKIVLKIEVPMKSDVLISQILSKNYKYREIVSGTAFEVSIPDLYSEEQRDILFTLELPILASPSDEPKIVLEAQLNYNNVISNSKKQIYASGSIFRVQETAPVVPTKSSYDVDLQKNRLKTADAMERAKAAADAGNLVQAQSILREAINQVKASESGGDKYCFGLISEMEECLRDLGDDKSYSNKGAKKMVHFAQSHQQQRSNNISSSYATSNKKTVMSKTPFYNNFVPSPKPVDYTYYASVPVAPPSVSYKAPAIAKPSISAPVSTLRLSVGNTHELIPSSIAKPDPVTSGKFHIHKWTAFVRATVPLSSYVEKVVFKLHPHYKPSVVSVSSEPFEITETGWGTFPLKIEIYFKPYYNKAPVTMTHKLCFEHGGESQTIDIPL